MTDPEADFDAEKRRRRYAACLAAAGASVITTIFAVQMYLEGVMDASGDAIWQISIGIFGIWLFFFVVKYIAAYALWFRPYANHFRAISLSLLAIFLVYLAMIGAGVFVTAFQGRSFDFAEAFKVFWEFHVMTYGLPYMAAFLVGWGFARPAPDMRDSF